MSVHSSTTNNELIEHTNLVKMMEEGERLRFFSDQDAQSTARDAGGGKASAPGQGQLSQREKRKAEIYLKDKELERDQEGKVIWKKKARRKNPMENSLALILESLQNYDVKIDLKDGSVVSGKIESVDPMMNLVLVKAIMTSPGSPGTQTLTHLESMELKGASIYLVHMPAGMNISAHVQRHKKSKEDARKRHEVKKSLTAQK